MHPTDDRDDAALVRAAQQGDKEAFGLLVARHAPSILSLAVRMLPRRDQADDAAQETFVAAYKSLQRFQFGAKFSTWLYGIALNKCRDALRAGRHDVVPYDDEASRDWDGAAPVDWTPDALFEQGELAGELERAVRALPVHYRESFILRHIDGLEYDEMSDALGVNRDTLKMRVYKARTLLCASLAHLQVRR
jgi:RNA polymerase sigma-70 factor (ECF subfamily)